MSDKGNAMAKARRFNENGEGATDLDLPGELFAAEVHEQSLYEAVKVHLRNRRQGTAKTKERGEISLSTAKLYRQKGTGRSRAGSAKSPIRTGGGTIFGPRPRPHKTWLNRKVRRLALRSALSDRASSEDVYVIDQPALDAPKTKHMAGLLGKMGLGGAKVLFVIADGDELLFRSLRNIPGVDVLPASQLNAYAVLRSDSVVFTDSALERVQEVFAQ